MKEIVTNTIDYLGPDSTYVQITVTGPDEESVERAIELIELDEDTFLKTL